MAKPPISPFKLLEVNIILFLSAMMMRGSGCSWNDKLDADLDRNVSRIRLCPIARGAISTSASHVCAASQLLIFFYVQTQSPAPTSYPTTRPCFYTSIPMILATGLYPLMKRITNCPQVFLSVLMPWGIAVAFPALDLDFLTSSRFMLAAGSFFLSNAAWVVLYDMIYAFQDVKDDVTAGIHSIVIRYKKNPKLVLSSLSLMEVGFLLISSFFMDARFVCCACMVGTLAALRIMIYKINLGSPASCASWSEYGCLFASAPTFCGFLSEYLRRVTRL